MCGRFAQPRSAEELARIFHARPASDVPGDRFNVAPTDEVAAVVEHHGERTVDAFRWGLVPFFATTAKDAARLINARSETVESSPAFRASFARHRCIIPADAFYEWRRERDPITGRTIRSEPFAVFRADGEPLALAGVWAIWRNPETAARVYTCSILTTDPNELVARLHDRMPVVLDPADWDAWLNESTPPTELRPMLRPAPAATLDAYAVSPAVNNVRNEGRELLAPLSRWSDGV
ncbi:MAG TPA: SOS response-associated peptidase [Candidatus Limnocylindria bacterium]|jgi:putative SOS response-associated peptidase YedK